MSSGETRFTGFYRKVVDAFNENNVEYLIVGGFAVNYHGFFRSTADMDIWVNKTEKNLENLEKAFLQLGYKHNKCKAAIDHFRGEHMITLPGEKNDLVELLDSFMLRINFDEAYQNRETLILENIQFNIIGLNNLLISKRKSTRYKDKLDVEELTKIDDLAREKRKGEGE